MKNFIKNEKFKLYIIFAIYLFLSLILLIDHKIWTDEAQAWEIAKSLSIPQIFAQMKYEAHPTLWYLILAIPAKLGLPVIFMNIISFVITSISVYIILFKSNLNFFIKALIIFNPTFIYYSSIVSRNYCLVILFLALFSLVYNQRFEKPIIYTIIIALMAHTHLIISGFVGISALIFLFELFRKKDYKHMTIAFFILLVSFIILALQLVPAIGNCVFIDSQPFTKKTLVSKIFDKSIKISSFFAMNLNEIQSLLLLLVILVVSTIVTFINSKTKGLILFVSILTIYLIHLAWPFVLSERTSMIFAIIVFLNLDNYKLFYSLFITIISILITYSNFKSITDGLFYHFSDSKNFASYINSNIEDNSLIVFIDIDRHMAAIPYINKNLVYYSIDEEKYNTFTSWRPKNGKMKNINEIEKKLKSFSKKYKNVYIMYGIYPDNDYPRHRINQLYSRGDIETMLYQTENGGSLEKFGLYKFKINA